MASTEIKHHASDLKTHIVALVEKAKRSSESDPWFERSEIAILSFSLARLMSVQPSLSDRTRAALPDTIEILRAQLAILAGANYFTHRNTACRRVRESFPAAARRAAQSAGRPAVGSPEKDAAKKFEAFDFSYPTASPKYGLTIGMDTTPSQRRLVRAALASAKRAHALSLRRRGATYAEIAPYSASASNRRGRLSLRPSA